MVGGCQTDGTEVRRVELVGERFHRCGASVDAGGWVTATRQTTDDRPEEALITRRGDNEVRCGWWKLSRD